MEKTFYLTKKQTRNYNKSMNIQILNKNKQYVLVLKVSTSIFFNFREIKENEWIKLYLANQNYDKKSENQIGDE